MQATGRLLAIVIAVLATVAAGPVLAETIGVTAAVNQAATGTRPSEGVRVLTLGDNVIHNERIVTDTGGLVQVLLSDGTTLTIGPRSDLTIDSYVYDPSAGTAKVATTLLKGALRFIGGASSKTEGGATVQTPAGTIGIRGAIADINLNPPAGTPVHIDMLFGTQLTLTSGGTLLGRLFAPGYSLVLGPGGVVVQKTLPAWVSQIQAALSGRAGAKGGAPASPTDQDVTDSGVPDANSQTALIPPVPHDPIVRSQETEITQTGQQDAEGDQDLFANVMFGAAAGILTYPDCECQGTAPLVTYVGEDGPDYVVHLAAIAFDLDGNAAAGVLNLAVPGFDQFEFTFDTRGTITGTSEEYTQSFPATVTLHDGDDVTLPNGVTPCTCAFLKWGTWESEITIADEEFGELHEFVAGTWAVGDLTTPEQLATLSDANAHFAGTAIGHVADLLDPDAVPAMVAADMSMSWNFADREGSMMISDFNGSDFYGYLDGLNSFPYFTGLLTDGYDGEGAVRGGFANDGTNLAAGVVGDFVILNSGGWGATGVIIGERATVY